MFKVGDEVLIKAEIMDIHEGLENPYFVQADNRFINWVSEDKIIPIDKTYLDGLSDAWELADKVYEMRNQQRYDVFGTESLAKVMDFSPQEALAKIESYEKEKSEIKVGDVVEYKNTLKAVVTRIENCEEVYVLWGDGSCGRLKKNEVLKKGKTADGLSELLRQIGE